MWLSTNQMTISAVVIGYYILYHECGQDMEIYPPKGFHIPWGRSPNGIWNPEGGYISISWQTPWYKLYILWLLPILFPTPHPFCYYDSTPHSLILTLYSAVSTPLTHTPRLTPAHPHPHSAVPHPHPSSPNPSSSTTPFYPF